MPETTINEITQKILEYSKLKRVLVNQIVLFGSESKGNSTKESDIDLAIISSDFSNRTYTERILSLLGLNRALVRLTDRAFDILYFSPSEWESNESPIINEAKNHGKIIYS